MGLVLMSSRRVLSTLYVTWPPRASVPTHVRAGSVVSIPPGSALEAAYGGPSNLQDVTADLGSPDTLDKQWLVN
jgi:hypothetical protein